MTAPDKNAVRRHTSGAIRPVMIQEMRVYRKMPGGLKRVKADAVPASKKISRTHAA